MDNEDDTADIIKSLARTLETYICDGVDVDRARQLVSRLGREEREAMTRQKNDAGDALLYVAVRCRLESYVTFLLDECCADVNLSCEGPPLLWWAAGGSGLADIAVIKILVEHGADVEHSTAAVNLACHWNSLAVVRYLIEHGADISIPDGSGNTCLMYAFEYNSNPEPLCQYLLDHGVSVNAVNEAGETALHCALKSHPDENVVRLLLRHGADASICNLCGDDALQTAALQYDVNILEYLVAELQPTEQRRVDLYALVGAQAVDRIHIFDAAMAYWDEPFTFPSQPPTPADASIAARNPAYHISIEALESLDADSLKDALYMRAIICRERIIGRSHPETILRLSIQALDYASNSDTYQRGIELYRYAAVCCCASLVRCEGDVEPHDRFCRLFWVKHEKDAASVRFDDAALVMRSIIELSKYHSLSSTDRCFGLWYVMSLVTPVVNLLSRLLSSEEERQSMKQLLRELVLKSRGNKVGTILFNAISPNSVVMTGYTKLMDLPNAAVVDELLEAGADVNEEVSAGKTPLHYALTYPPEDASQRGAWLGVIDLLLRRGAHVDVRDDNGLTAVDLLPPHVDKMEYTTLQCLAARAIRQHGVEYRSVLPKSLADFVALH